MKGMKKMNNKYARIDRWSLKKAQKKEKSKRATAIGPRRSKSRAVDQSATPPSS